MKYNDDSENAIVMIYLIVLKRLMESESRRLFLDRVVGMYSSGGGEKATLRLDLNAEDCAVLPAWLLHASHSLLRSLRAVSSHARGSFDSKVASCLYLRILRVPLARHESVVRHQNSCALQSCWRRLSA